VSIAAFQLTPKSRRSIAVSARNAAAVFPLNGDLACPS